MNKLIKLVFFALTILFNINVNSQKVIDKKDYRSNFAKSTSRIKFKEDLVKRIDSVFNTKLTKNNERAWIKAFDDAALFLIKNKKVERAIKSSFKGFETSTSKFIYSLIQTAFTLYPQKFHKEIEGIFKLTNDRDIFSASTLYLINNKNNSKGNSFFIQRMKEKFPSWSKDPVLLQLNYYLSKRSISLPPLKGLLSNEFIKDKTIVYSFQRKDRTYLGITIIKKPDGSFVRNEDNTIFYVTHFARSASNMPGFLVNGNTPQGIYTIEGYYISPNIEIGPTPILLTRIPFEKPSSVFYHGKNKSNKWNIDDYKELLPLSWQNYFPMYEAFYSGKAGRRLIVAHGSADDPEFYKEQDYYPLIPTKGCLSALEIWDEKGRLIKSDQVKLMNAYFSANQRKGFLVVVEIDDKKKPVTIEEILPAINAILN